MAVHAKISWLKHTLKLFLLGLVARYSVSKILSQSLSTVTHRSEQYCIRLHYSRVSWSVQCEATFRSHCIDVWKNIHFLLCYELSKGWRSSGVLRCARHTKTRTVQNDSAVQGEKNRTRGRFFCRKSHKCDGVTFNDLNVLTHRKQVYNCLFICF